MILIYLSVSLLVQSCSGWIVKVDSFEVECFYKLVQQNLTVGLEFQVVDGGFLDIDFNITSPDGNEIYEGLRKSDDKLIFTANQDGKYKFCFSNKMSTVTIKTVMFDIIVGKSSEWSAEGLANQSARVDTTATMIAELGQALKSVQHEQEFISVRNQLHRRISEHTNLVVLRWALFELCIVVLGSAFEVWYIKRFFEIRRIV